MTCAIDATQANMHQERSRFGQTVPEMRDAYISAQSVDGQRWRCLCTSFDSDQQGQQEGQQSMYLA
jgi:hypothetical protein